MTPRLCCDDPLTVTSPLTLHGWTHPLVRVGESDAGRTLPPPVILNGEPSEEFGAV